MWCRSICGARAHQKALLGKMSVDLLEQGALRLMCWPWSDVSAEIERRSISDFLVGAAQEAARRTIEQTQIIR